MSDAERLQALEAAGWQADPTLHGHPTLGLVWWIESGDRTGFLQAHTGRIYIHGGHHDGYTFEDFFRAAEPTSRLQQTTLF